MTTDYKRLGGAVIRRRCRLGLTQEDVETAGGPSPMTLRRIEHGEGGPYRPVTLIKLERALQWQSGAILAILNDEEWNSPDNFVDEPTKDDVAAWSALAELDPSVVAEGQPDYLMDIEGFIAWVGISRRTFNQWCQDGTAPKRLKLGRQVRIKWSDCLEWLESRYVNSVK